jgi:hypothetical protein
MKIEINLNDAVKVRLTEYGKECLSADNERMREQYPNWTNLPVKYDSNGWSEWNLWTLFKIFGSCIDMSNDIPFDNNIIRIDDGY